MTLAGFLLLGVAALAYANGANDNSKGIATLIGSGTATERPALRWAALTTFLGSICVLFLGGELVRRFTGQGLVGEAVAADPAFLAAAGIGAAATVLLATRLGLPISTTHALIGGLVGAGWTAIGTDLAWERLGTAFFLPLAVSPFLAVGITAILYPCLRWGRRRLGITRETCLCVGEEIRVIACDPALRSDTTAVTVAETSVTVSLGNSETCIERYNGRVAGIAAGTALNVAHWISGGAVGFARGLNDAPKIVGILAGTTLVGIPIRWGIVWTAIGMGIGGLMSARRVAHTMSHRITTMNHGQGFSANLVTAFLVIFASRWGLPVSTTHVSCGALFGLGAVTGGARWNWIARILVAWLTVLPVAVALGAGTYLLLR